MRCRLHGTFEQNPNSHLSGQGCPNCKTSKGELILERYLKQNNFNYKSQYYFKDLKDKRYLKFDFGILDNDNNLQYLIEFNGEQHYKYNYHMHRTNENFLISKNRDKLKHDYCVVNNIPLYIIKYDENIENRMTFLTK